MGDVATSIFYIQVVAVSTPELIWGDFSFMYQTAEIIVLKVVPFKKHKRLGTTALLFYVSVWECSCLASFLLSAHPRLSDSLLDTKSPAGLLNSKEYGRLRRVHMSSRCALTAFISQDANQNMQN